MSAMAAADTNSAGASIRWVGSSREYETVTVVLSGGDKICQVLSVVVGAAKDQLGCLGSPDVEVRVVLPREADAAVNAHVVQRHLQKRVRTGHFGHRRRRYQVRSVGHLRGVYDGRARPFDQ